MGASTGQNPINQSCEQLLLLQHVTAVCSLTALTAAAAGQSVAR